MKALVTGGAGFIGFHVCERLLEEGHEVCIVDNLKGPSGRESLLNNVSDIQRKGPVVFREVDIRDQSLLLESFSEFKPECTIHLAALAGVRESLNNPVEYVSVNVAGTERVLNSAVLAGCSRVVNISSGSVYGEGFGTPKH